jgi:hypothetical protein
VKVSRAGRAERDLVGRQETGEYTSMFPSVQLLIFLQLFHSLSQHVSTPVGHHQMLLFAKIVNSSNINCSY